MEKSPEQHHPPFKKESPLNVLSGASGMNVDLERLHELNKTYIVRRFPIDLDQEQRRAFDAATNRKVRSAILQEARGQRVRDERTADELFEKLRDEYGIRVAPYRRIVGPDTEGAPQAIYAIVNRIQGERLDLLPPEEIKKYKKEIERTFTGLFNQMAHVLQYGGVFHSELNANQFMAGIDVHDKQKEPGVYLVDIDPLCFNYTPNGKQDDTNTENLVALGAMILKLVGDLEIQVCKRGQIELPEARMAAIRCVSILAAKNDVRVADFLHELRTHGSEIVTAATNKDL